jgi:hypothetical protein
MNELPILHKHRYGCMYKGKEMEVQATTIYGAQLIAASAWKVKDSWKVTVMLIGLGTDPDTPVVHTAVD